MADVPRVSFGMIVFNGEPFLRYNLRSIYPLAHQILVVEGACMASASQATPDGHSTDGTLETLRDFQANEDPQKKLQVISRTGFWSEKDEQSQAYALRATGDYLWQIDVDEFYFPEQMRHVLERMEKNPELTAASFKQITFWGGFRSVVDGWYLRGGADQYRRLFRWKPGYSYSTHRPPTVRDERGIDLFDVRPLRGRELAAEGILLYHYSLLLPKQVAEKSAYYGAAGWASRPGATAWAQEVFMELRHPFRVHNVYNHVSWLERYEGTHPPQIEAMRRDIDAGTVSVELRATEDIDRLLSSPEYKMRRTLLMWIQPVDALARWIIAAMRKWIDRLLHPIRTVRGAIRHFRL